MSVSRLIATLVVAVAVTVAAALRDLPAFEQPLLHMAVVLAVALGLVVMAVRARAQRVASGANESAIAASTAAHLGLVWAWGALSILLTYVLLADKHWPEWWQFFLGFAAAAGGSLAFAALLNGDASKDNADDTLIRIGRFLIQLQIAGMALGIITMIIDGKFPRAISQADWAGCHLCFFGALAIAAISIDALRRPGERVMQN